ncbi:hypothetical protein Tcan_02358 [Toxocara canis]|uniref:Kinesin-like protein Kif23 Arf6-interacting domain-containing protein n=1 Tax=Toxocara canis TaxID=6265 RepID=A0A0B2UPN4_TOXCA|nr:hypothetical protein Tcan_02358 [Toxocara canis]
MLVITAVQRALMDVLSITNREFASLRALTCSADYLKIQTRIPGATRPTTRVEMNDLKKSNEYVLTHQEVDSEGNLMTRLVKVSRCTAFCIYTSPHLSYHYFHVLLRHYAVFFQCVLEGSTPYIANSERI